MSYQSGQYTTTGATLGSMVGPWGTVVGAAVGVIADVVIGGMEARKAKEAQEEYLGAVRDNAVLNQTYQNRAMNIQHQQIAQQGAQEKLDTRINALKIADRAGMSAGENGVSGNSIHAQVQSIFGKGNRAEAQVGRNMKAAGAQLMIGKKQGQAAINSQVSGVQTQRTGVNYLGIGAAAATAGAGAYKEYKGSK